MSWFVIYQTEDGRLVSGTDDSTKIASTDILIARGYSVKEFPDLTNGNGSWNPTTLVFDAVLANSVLSRVDFMLRFTQTERIAIRTSTDPIVVDFLDLMSHADTIDLLNIETQNGVKYLEGIAKLIAVGRAAIILAP